MANAVTSMHSKYQERLRSIPAPGEGNNCHTYLLGVANLGIMAGVSPEQIFKGIRANVPRGKRPVPDREILDAIKLAVRDHADGRFVSAPKPKPLVTDGAAILRKLIQQGRGVTEADIRNASPTRIDPQPESDPAHALPLLYHGGDLLFIGERAESGIRGKTIRTCAEWAQYFRGGGKPGPHIIVNPLSGTPAPKKSGGMTYRGDGNVVDFRFCVTEFDALDRDSQLAFWAVVNLPIVALVDSGGKSIHAWLDVRKLADVRTAEEWDYHIRERLYRQLLIPLGVDSACANPARLSRLPGHFRAEKGRIQRLLYLAPDGRRVFS